MKIASLLSPQVCQLLQSKWQPDSHIRPSRELPQGQIWLKAFEFQLHFCTNTLLTQGLPCEIKSGTGNLSATCCRRTLLASQVLILSILNSKIHLKKTLLRLPYLAVGGDREVALYKISFWRNHRTPMWWSPICKWHVWRNQPPGQKFKQHFFQRKTEQEGRSSIHDEVRMYKNTRKNKTGFNATVEYKEAAHIIHT